jgi:hypothetical protein
MSKLRRVLVGTVVGALASVVLQIGIPARAAAQANWFLVCSESVRCTMSYTGSVVSLANARLLPAAPVAASVR